MNINIFFVFVSSVLLVILFAFKPLDIQQKVFTDVPLFNISSFTIYELNTKGLETFMSGNEATRYVDRYTIKDMDYTDNSKKYLANMKANKGIFKDKVVDLIGDVVYLREDGLTFTTQKARYDKRSAIATSKGKFTLYKESNVLKGTHLKYNNIKNTIDAQNITITYQIPDTKE